MSRNSNQTWNTKYGARRVRHEAPTLEEAIVAAQGLSDELNEQVEIAASLVGLPLDQVRTELLKVTPPRKDVIKSVVFAGPNSAPRTIVVERKPARRVISGPIVHVERQRALNQLSVSAPKSSKRPSSVGSWPFTR